MHVGAVFLFLLLHTALTQDVPGCIVEYPMSGQTFTNYMIIVFSISQPASSIFIIFHCNSGPCLGLVPYNSYQLSLSPSYFPNPNTLQSITFSLPVFSPNLGVPAVYGPDEYKIYNGNYDIIVLSYPDAGFSGNAPPQYVVNNVYINASTLLGAPIPLSVSSCNVCEQCNATSSDTDIAGVHYYWWFVIIIVGSFAVAVPTTWLLVARMCKQYQTL